MHIYAARAVAISQLTAPTFLSTTTPNRYWDSAVWDGQKYDLIDGTFYAGASCNILLRQGQASGYWDYTKKIDVWSGQTHVITDALVGRYLQARVTTVTGVTPAVFRFGLWGKIANQEKVNYPTIVPKGVLLCTTDSGGTQLATTPVSKMILRALPENNGAMYIGGMSGVGQPFSGFGMTVITPGDALTLPMDNADKVFVCSTASGDRVIYGGVR